MTASGEELPDFIVKRVIGIPGDTVRMDGNKTLHQTKWLVPSCDAGHLCLPPRGVSGPIHGRLMVEFLEDRAYLTVVQRASPGPFPAGQRRGRC